MPKNWWSDFQPKRRRRNSEDAGDFMKWMKSCLPRQRSSRPKQENLPNRTTSWICPLCKTKNNCRVTSVGTLKKCQGCNKKIEIMERPAGSFTPWLWQAAIAFFGFIAIAAILAGMFSSRP